MGYLLAPQSVVVGSLSEQEVLEQPEKAHQAGTVGQRLALGVSQVRQGRLQHHLQQAGTHTHTT